MGAQAGLKAMALTDHDSTQGFPEFFMAGRDKGVETITGVEISVDVDPGTMHMLGYHMDLENERFQATLAEVRVGREERNSRILEKFNEMGMTLTWDDVKQHAREDVVGRPHFALALIARGYAKNKTEVFAKYLGKGQVAYIERPRLSPKDAIDVIIGAGGVPVLAHPFTLKLSSGKLRQYVRELAGLGLKGIEVHYSEHAQDRVELYKLMACENGLLTTGGSDFHGLLNPNIYIGRGFGSLRVPDDVLIGLAAAAGRN
jgi:predicted metal-dependent phosphoesterase TrpH